MAHPDLKWSYNVIKTKCPPESKEITEMFIEDSKQIINITY